MTRKGFFTAIAGMITAPFIAKSEPQKNELPKDRVITPEDVEVFVKKEVDRRIKSERIELSSDIKVYGNDILFLLKR